MTWIRLDTDRRDHQVIARLAQRLKVRLAEAGGLYDNALLGFGEHQKDGDATKVTDVSLEQWATWEGKRGRFAKAFREECVIRKAEDSTHPSDRVGKVKGWMKRQWKLLEKQRLDALKRKGGKGLRVLNGGGSEGHPPKALEGAPEKPSRVPRGLLGGTLEESKSDGTSNSSIPLGDISQLVAATAGTLRVRPRRDPALDRAVAASPRPGSEIQ